MGSVMVSEETLYILEKCAYMAMKGRQVSITTASLRNKFWVERALRVRIGAEAMQNVHIEVPGRHFHKRPTMLSPEQYEQNLL